MGGHGKQVLLKFTDCPYDNRSSAHQTQPQPQPQPQQGLIEPDPYDYKVKLAAILRELRKFDDNLIPFHKDGSTSYAPVLDPGRVAEGSGGQYYVPLIVRDGQRLIDYSCDPDDDSEVTREELLEAFREPEEYGITSYALVIDHLGRVALSKRALHHILLSRNPSAGGNDGGPNGGNQFKRGKDPRGENTGRLNGGVGTYNELHYQSSGHGFFRIASLKGHRKVILAIVPSGSGKLYSGSKDETVKVWDSGTGQCVTTINMGREVGCMISEGPWLFVGIPGSIKVWNTQTGAEMSLSCPTGQVYALVVANDMLFAGTEDGRILVWRYNSAPTNCFEPVTSLMGHHLAVIALVIGGTILYSGSMDHTIKAWNLTTLQCIQTLSDHTNVVMSLLCCDQFLISCSLDNTVKFWSTNNKKQLEVTYTHKEEHGVLALCGMDDLQGKPVLLCSLKDNSVRLYDLLSFNERGRIFAKQEVRTVQAGPRGIFFTGDGTGEIKVWQWST